jgi:hypothetical protein
MVFAKLKALLRKADERSIEATWRKIGDLRRIQRRRMRGLPSPRGICFDVNLTDAKIANTLRNRASCTGPSMPSRRSAKKNLLQKSGSIENPNKFDDVVLHILCCRVATADRKRI